MMNTTSLVSRNKIPFVCEAALCYAYLDELDLQFLYIAWYNMQKENQHHNAKEIIYFLLGSHNCETWSIIVEPKINLH